MPPYATASPFAVDEVKEAVSTLPNTLNPKYWYLYGKPYDFTTFVPKHPGGRKAIMIGQGLYSSYFNHMF